MILTFNYEELRALASGADLLLSRWDRPPEGAVAAPAEALAQIELLLPRLTGPLSIETLSEQRSLREAVDLIRRRLHERMEAAVIEYHPAHEEAVALYFDYAHTVSVLARLDEIGAEMNAMIELMTGRSADAAAAEEITFTEE